MTMRVRREMTHYLLVFYLVLNSAIVCAQSVVQELDMSTGGLGTSEIFVEKVKTISNSKKIFILTNDNQLLSKGDFISILIEGNLVTRALVAKTTKDRAGIKMMKIYSLAMWRQLRRGLDVQIIKGDDAAYRKSRKKEMQEKKKTESDDGFPSISDEDDLFNNKLIGDLDDQKKRILPNDHIVSVSYGQYAGKNKDNEAQNYTHWGASWMYQVSPNIFGEAFVGTSQMSEFPSEGVNASVVNIVARLKYTFALPLYSYAQPYIGYQSATMQLSNSDLIGDENELVADSEKTGIVFGVTVLRRLVPGWFIKADIGTDIFNVGFAIEF